MEGTLLREMVMASGLDAFQRVLETFPEENSITGCKSWWPWTVWAFSLSQERSDGRGSSHKMFCCAPFLFKKNLFPDNPCSDIIFMVVQTRPRERDMHQSCTRITSSSLWTFIFYFWKINVCLPFCLLTVTLTIHLLLECKQASTDILAFCCWLKKESQD